MCESSVDVTGSDESWFRLVSFSCLRVRSHLSLAPLMILWMEMMQGVSMTVIWVNSATRVMMGVMQGVFEVGQVHQATWIWCPYSSCPSGKTQISPCWADGLERNCFLGCYLSFFTEAS